MRRGKIVIDFRSRIVPTNRRVTVDTPVVFHQLDPQGAAKLVVSLDVIANDKPRQGW